jgi:ribonuclease P protein component
MAGRFAFPPASRLHGDRDYGRVFQRQQKSAGPHLVALLRPRPRAGREPERARLGVMVSTKVAARAVRRHELKRWARELFRLELQESLQGWDLVLLLRKDPPADGHAVFAQEVRDQVRRALTRQPQPGDGRRERRSGGERGGGRSGGGASGGRDGSPRRSPR